MLIILFLDRHSTAEPEVREAEEVKFKDVSEAYSVLTDPKRRRRYDTGEDLEGGIGKYMYFHGFNNTRYTFKNVKKLRT